MGGMGSCGCREHWRTLENDQEEILHNSISPLGLNPEVHVENFPYIRWRKNHSQTSTIFFSYSPPSSSKTLPQNAIHQPTIAHRNAQAGGGDEESMGGTGEGGARERGGPAMGSRGRGEAGGGEDTTGGGGEKMVSRGHPSSREGIQGTGVADRQVIGGVLAVPTEGGEADGGGHGRPGALPRLPVKENRLHMGVSKNLSLLLFFC